MAVQWGLAGQGFNPLQVLQSAGMAQQQKMQQAQAEQEQRMQQQRMQIGQQAAQGDFRGAQNAALAFGDFDLGKSLQGMGKAELDRAGVEAESIARVANALKAVPADQRGQAFQQYIPLLRQAGFDDSELQGVDLSDDGINGYVNFATSLQDQIRQSQPDYQVIPEGGTLVDTRNPQALQQFGRQPGPVAQSGGGDLESMAAQAIANGADPAAVQARMQQLRQQQGGGQTGAPSGNFLP